MKCDQIKMKGFSISDQLSVTCSLVITLSPSDPSVLGVENFVPVLTDMGVTCIQLLPLKSECETDPHINVSCCL